MFSFIKDTDHVINEKNRFSINLNKINKRVESIDNFIIVKDKKIKIYDRNCDHMGGKIISKNKEHICPIHQWKFDPLSGKYSNGLKKEELKFKIIDNIIYINQLDKYPNISISKKNSDFKIRFFNHAFLQVESNDFKFATDPWAIGPAFNTGWWLKNNTKSDWIKELNKCSFIYISHNHPDHLHPLTLSKVDKNIPIVVPKFNLDSAGKYMESLGFKNIFRLEFLKDYKFKDTNLNICLLKSGDFREDSGIYFSIGKFTSLFDVDSNMINFDKVPKVDLYASSFAGGASGYPLMFENYSEKEKLEMLNKDLMFGRSKKLKMIKKIYPKYFLPYAGFFEEKLDRDKKIKILNKKNKIEDYENNLKKTNIEVFNIQKYDEFYFVNNKLLSKKKNKSKLTKDLTPNQYLNFYKKNYKNIDLDYLKKYFVESNFRDNLILYLTLTDDNFNYSKFNFKIDFRSKKVKFTKLKKIDLTNLDKINKYRVLILKCRQESFLNTIYNKAPWEDLSIGFQTKILRFPNVYNINFWDHFTNKYTTTKNVRVTSKCANCELITNYVDNLIYKTDLSKNF